MYIFLNKTKNRLIISIAFILVCSMLILFHQNLFLLRQNALEAVKSISFILAIMSALSVSIFNNYVVGIKDRYLKKVSEIRDRLEGLYDKFSISSKDNILKINEEFIYPLLCLSSEDWLAFDTPNEIRISSKKVFENAHNDNSSFLPRYLLRIEDELNYLGILYIKRVVIKNYLAIIKETFFLIALGILTIVISYVLPNNLVFNIFSILICLVVIFWAMIAILYIGSFLYNNGEEEGDELYGYEN